MKPHRICLIFLFTLTICIQAQVAVKYNGYKQLESTIATHPNNSNILATAVIEFPITGRQSIICVSTDNGSTWTQKKTIVNAADPVIEFDNNGNIFFSYLSRTDDEIYIIKSADLGETWTNNIQVSNSGGTHNADKEWLCVDRNTNYIYIVWVEHGVSSELKFSRSTNVGASYSQPVSIVSDVPGLFSPFITTGNSGLVYITYAILHDHNQSNATFDLMFAKSTNYGLNFTVSEIDANLKAPGYFRGGNQETFVLKYVETNGERSFRIYAVPSMAVNNQNGNVYIIVNHREEKNYSSGLTETDYSDLILYRSTNNGINWLQQRILDWEDAGGDYYQNDGDQFFPSITCNENGNIYCLFYNSIDDFFNRMTKLSIAYSSDQGENFGIIHVDNAEFDPSIGSFSAYNFIGDYIQTKNSAEKISFAYTKPHQVDPHHILFYHSRNLTNNITLYNNVNNNNTLGDIYVDETRYTNLPQTLPLNLSDHSIESPNLVNEWKFYKWQSALDPLINESRIKKDNFVADINKSINSKFEQTKPLTVRNYLEGGNGGTILFGEKDFDVLSRISPYTENAFLYNPPTVQSVYRAVAEPTHNLFNTSWNFWRWENGSMNRIRQEQITQSSPSEWRANYKAQLRSNDQNAISSASQRKIVRTDNGRYHVVYESMYEVWYTHSLTTNFQGAWSQDYSINEGQGQAKNPSIDFEGNKVKIVMEFYDPNYNANAIIFLITWEPDVNGNYYLSDFEDVQSYSPSYLGNAKPVISSTTGEIFVAYRKNATEGIKQRTRFYYSGNWGNWTTEADIPGTNSYCINPAVIGEPGYIHIAYEYLYGIYYRFGYRHGQSSWRFDVPTQNLSARSGFNVNSYPAISLSLNNPNKYVMVSWQGIYGASPTNPLPKETGGSDPFFRKAAVVKVGWGSSWSTSSDFSNNVDFTNNGSLNTAYGSIMTWSESNGQHSKFVRRRTTTGYDPITSLSTNGIHTLVSNGSEFGNIKAMVFNKSTNAPYLLNRCTNDFTYIPDGFGKISEAGIVDISFGRSGVVEKNGIEFVFNIGDVLLNGETIKFIERADTLPVPSIEELNLSVRTDTLYLNPQSELIFSDYYYVVNGERADSLLSNEFNVNFKCELVKLSNGNVIGVFEQVNYNKTNLEEFGHQGYLVDCSGIETGEYYLRLTSSVNEEVGLSLSDIQMDNVLLEKSKLNVRNFKGEKIPIEYALEQNYPNPFNPTTTIRYQIPKDGMVTLKVYDILGAEVVTLVNEEKVAGKYEVNFNASNLASGVYIYRLSVNDPSTSSGQGYVNVKKMILLK